MSRKDAEKRGARDEYRQASKMHNPVCEKIHEDRPAYDSVCQEYYRAREAYWGTDK